MKTVNITAAQKLKIKTAVNYLNKTLIDIQSSHPENLIQWYLEDNNNLHLMSGDSHDDSGRPRQDRVIITEQLDMASGGGW